jgi:hypothetical protein
MNPDRLWKNERLMIIKLKQGMNPWWETGRGNIPAGCASMAIAPVGIINAGDPRQAYQDAFCIAGINQDGNNRDFAATLAAGIAAAFAPGATVDSVLEAMLTHSDCLTRRALTMTFALVQQSGSVDEFADRFYASPLLDWTWPQPNWKLERHFSGNSLEFGCVVPAILRLCDGDVNRCLVEGASFGRDCDTIANLVGCIAGAMAGASAVRPEWVEQVETANAPIFQELHGDANRNFRAMAEHMVVALRAEAERSRTRAVLLDGLLGDS